MLRNIFSQMILLSVMFACGPVCADDLADYPPKFQTENYLTNREKLIETLVPEERLAAVRILDRMIDFVAEKSCAPEKVVISCHQQERYRSFQLSTKEITKGSEDCDASASLFYIKDGHVLTLHLTKFISHRNDDGSFSGFAHQEDLKYLDKAILDDVGSLTHLEQLFLGDADFDEMAMQAALDRLTKLKFVEDAYQSRITCMSVEYIKARRALYRMLPWNEPSAATTILEKMIAFIAEKEGCLPKEIRVGVSETGVELWTPKRDDVRTRLFTIRDRHIREVDFSYDTHFPAEFNKPFLEAVSNLSRLTRLDFGTAKLDAGGLVDIKKLDDLQYLSLSGALADEHWELISRFPELRGVYNADTPEVEKAPEIAPRDMSMDEPMKSPTEDYRNALEKLTKYLVPEERAAAKRILDWALDFLAVNEVAQPEEVDFYVTRKEWEGKSGEPGTIYVILKDYGGGGGFRMDLFAIYDGHVVDIHFNSTEYPPDIAGWQFRYPKYFSRELLEDIGTFTKLKRLWLYSAYLEPEGIPALKNLTELEELDISSFQAADLEMLSGFPHLKKLTHHDAEKKDVERNEYWKRNLLTEEKLEKLAGFKDMVSLGLNGSADSAAMLEKFPELASRAWNMNSVDEDDEEWTANFADDEDNED